MSGGLYSMEGKDFDKTLDLTKIKPYGDTMNDGKTQLVLPCPSLAAMRLLKLLSSLYVRWDWRILRSFSTNNSPKVLLFSTVTAPLPTRSIIHRYMYPK